MTPPVREGHGFGIIDMATILRPLYHKFHLSIAHDPTVERYLTTPAVQYVPDTVHVGLRFVARSALVDIAVNPYTNTRPREAAYSGAYVLAAHW